MTFYISVLLFIQFLFGTNFVVSKIIVGNIDPIVFASIRFIISGFALILIQKLRGKSLGIERAHWPILLFLAFAGIGMGQACFMIGLKKSTAVNTSLLSSTIPIFVFLINKLRGVSDWSRVKLIGLCCSFFGVLYLRKLEEFSLSSSAIQGDLLVLLACFLLGLSLSYSKDLFSKVCPVAGSAHMFWLGGFVLLPFCLLGGFTSFEPSIFSDQNFLLAFLYSIFGATCLTYYLNNWILTKLDSNIVGLFIFLQPLIASIIAYFYLNEPITIRMMISFALIIFGVSLVIGPKKAKN